VIPEHRDNRDLVELKDLLDCRVLTEHLGNPVTRAHLVLQDRLDLPVE
jgi:hypothetical protein